MTQDQWTRVDAYFNGLFAPADEALSGAIQAIAAAGMPAISVSATQGKFLGMLARMIGARSILEIGTLGGYSAICMARSLPDDGRLLSLEINPAHADVARANIERAGLSSVVEVRLGSAHDTLPKLVESGDSPFDMVFIDADKASTPDYLNWALRLTKPGSLIIVDNVVRDGAVADSTSTNADVQGIQRGLVAMSQDPRLSATAIQTVGDKGYDGFAIALVTGE